MIDINVSLPFSMVRESLVEVIITTLNKRDFYPKENQIKSIEFKGDRIELTIGPSQEEEKELWPD